MIITTSRKSEVNDSNSYEILQLLFDFFSPEFNGYHDPIKCSFNFYI